ncbi:DUF3795 domain-containing protein [Zongyangia hominis]|uniref:DUF3795 domain-containing protein n=1 Tax=Zongyangia hominis TaxID=2763677 RepID=A0A926IAT5_9FIRM|nr:DUF3795 domain-containing protein [Zongyangia hominis]MBC8569447.1 DUF3795 domain-containing protein [Zongyangia hominis]
MKHTGYCGLDCTACPLFIAKQTGDVALMERTAREYSTEACTFSAGDMICGGCRSDEVSEKMCQGCGMRSCAREKNADSCAACPQYPCAVTDQYMAQAESC